MKKSIHFLGLIMIYIMTSSFGLVEYSAMRPHTYFVGIDSTKMKQSPLASAKKELNQVQKKEEENQQDAQLNEEGSHWSKYIVLGVKAIFSTLLSLVSYMIK
ncbi:hypothetical protein EWU23_00310 [Cytophagaceae bacterium 50C-KIRBA]|uniref:DUF4134 domain-containing protein n=1 Tax=Aquirufa beregesia TaxID=2516556 RepID=A0ABX0ETK3_9BACT|nr:hypothetical protein [Aquirufa beregesia]NGZ42912.1 hypothetical protein [Aquirufa beregesia]